MCVCVWPFFSYEKIKEEMEHAFFAQDNLPDDSVPLRPLYSSISPFSFVLAGSGDRMKMYAHTPSEALHTAENNHEDCALIRGVAHI